MAVCDVPGIGTACDVVQGATEAVSFASDPLGYIAQKLQEASAGLADSVFPALNSLTHPDLTQRWFLDAYQVTWAIAMFLWVMILLWTLLLRARRRISGDELLQTFTTYTPLFLGGCAFGPALGVFMLKGVGLASDSLAKWGLESVDGTTAKLQDAIRAGDADQIAGGSVVAIVVFGALIISLLLVLFMLLVMLVTLYLTGAVMPIGLAWVTHPRQRSKGLRLIYVWVGVAFAHVLVFLLLGIAFRMVAGLAAAGGSPLQVLVNLAVAVIALFLATLSPGALIAFAPVGPTDGGAGGGMSLNAPGEGLRSGWSGTDSPTDSHTAQLSRSTGGVSGGGEDTDSGDDAPGPLSRHLQSLQAAGGSGGSAGRPSTAGLGASSNADAAAGGAKAGAGAAEAGGAAAGAAEAGEAVTAAGAATTATGVLAPAGMVLAGVGIAMAGTAGAAQEAGQIATEHMDHADGGAQDAPDPSPRW